MNKVKRERDLWAITVHKLNENSKFSTGEKVPLFVTDRKWFIRVKTPPSLNVFEKAFELTDEGKAIDEVANAYDEWYSETT